MADSTSTPAPELKTYYGNCHCGAFKFNIRIPELTSATECNCSICFKKAYKWVFPGPDCFTIEKGDGILKEYEFGKKTMAHKFCGICGTGVQGLRHNAPPGMDIGVNVRALRDVDVDALKLNTYVFLSAIIVKICLTCNRYAGIDAKPSYIPPTFTSTEPKAELENAKLYTGGCHCGSHAMAMKTSGPVTEGYECDCSVCTRVGSLLSTRCFSTNLPIERQHFLFPNQVRLRDYQSRVSYHLPVR